MEMHQVGIHSYFYPEIDLTCVPRTKFILSDIGKASRYSALHVRLESKSHEKLFVLVVRDSCHAADALDGNTLTAFAKVHGWLSSYHLGWVLLKISE